jgi:hypothetical protein
VARVVLTRPCHLLAPPDVMPSPSTVDAPTQRSAELVQPSVLKRLAGTNAACLVREPRPLPYALHPAPEGSSGAAPSSKSQPCAAMWPPAGESSITSRILTSPNAAWSRRRTASNSESTSATPSWSSRTAGCVRRPADLRPARPGGCPPARLSVVPPRVLQGRCVLPRGRYSRR